MVCILGIGLYLSIRTGFIQIRKFGLAIPDLIGVFLLSGTVIKLIKNYFSGEEYIPFHKEAEGK